MGNSNTKESSWMYLLLSVGAFFGLALEGIHAFVWEPLVYGGISLREYNDWQSILHWMITCFTWLGVAYLLIRFARNKLGFDIFAKGESMKPWQWVTTLLSVVFALYISYTDWEGFKIIKEFQNKGWLKFIFQYIYYMVETVLFTLIIVFGQKAFEICTKKRNVPWGGLFCAITWGIVHIISRGYLDIQNGLFASLKGFMFGVAYLLANRDFIKSYFILSLMFVL